MSHTHQLSFMKPYQVYGLTAIMDVQYVRFKNKDSCPVLSSHKSAIEA